MGLVAEFRRRNVFRVAIAYVIIAWLILQVGDTLAPALRLPDWVNTALAFFLILGFPLAIFFAWAYELTPEGIKLEQHVDRSQSITNLTGKKLDYVIIAVLAVALSYFAFDKFMLDTSREAEPVRTTTEDVTEQIAKTQTVDKSIAVLAFADLSPEGDQEYFSDGISEEILNLLAKVPELRVTSRSSAFSFKDQNLDVPTIAARLNVAHILEGSVRKSGNQLRITVQLIEGVTDTHLWSETYNRELKDVFAIQDEIAAAVVGALKITLLGRELKTTETSPEAYALYLQGRHFNSQGTAESNKHAETLLKQALEIDPRFGAAWSELGSVYTLGAFQFSVRTFDEGYELARDAIQQALAIDTQYGDTYAALASIEMYYDFDFVAASQHLEQALKLNPGDAAIFGEAAQLKKTLGLVEEAIDLYRKSVALDPVSPNRHYRLGRMYYWAHHLEEAANSLQLAISLGRGHAGAEHYLSLVLLAQEDAPAALEQVTDDMEQWQRLHVMAIVQHVLGDAGASDAALNGLIEEAGATAGYQIAEIYAFRGENDHAFDWLDRAYDARDAGLTHLLVDPLLVNLHDDPRWEPFLGKMGLLH